MGSGAAIVDVAQNVQLVDGQTLDDVTDGADEIIGTTCRYDGVDNHTHIGRLIVVAQTLVQQLLDDIGKIARQRLAHLGAGVLAADVAAHLYQLVDGNAIPIVDILLLGLDELQLLLGIVDEGAKLLLLALADIIAKEFVYFSLDVTGGVFQDVAKCLALAVYIGQKVLCALGQGHNSLEVNNLGRCIGNRGE